MPRDRAIMPYWVPQGLRSQKKVRRGCVRQGWMRGKESEGLLPDGRGEGGNSCRGGCWEVWALFSEDG